MASYTGAWLASLVHNTLSISDIYFYKRCRASAAVRNILSVCSLPNDPLRDAVVRDKPSVVSLSCLRPTRFKGTHVKYMFVHYATLRLLCGRYIFTRAKWYAHVHFDALTEDISRQTSYLPGGESSSKPISVIAPLCCANHLIMARWIFTSEI